MKKMNQSEDDDPNPSLVQPPGLSEVVSEIEVDDPPAMVEDNNQLEDFDNEDENPEPPTAEVESTDPDLDEMESRLSGVFSLLNELRGRIPEYTRRFDNPGTQPNNDDSDSDSDSDSSSDSDSDEVDFFSSIERVKKAESELMVTKLREWNVRNSVSHPQLRDSLLCVGQNLVFYDGPRIFEMDISQSEKGTKPDCKQLVEYEADPGDEDDFWYRDFVFFRKFESCVIYGFNSAAYIHYNNTSRKERVLIPKCESEYNDVVMTRDGKYLFGVGQFWSMRAFQIKKEAGAGSTSKVILSSLVVRKMGSYGNTIALSKNERYLGVGTDSSGYYLYRLENLKMPVQFQKQRSSVNQTDHVEFNCSKYEPPLFLAASGPYVKVYSLKTNREKCCKFEDRVSLAKWSPTLPNVFFAASRYECFYACKISQSGDGLEVYRLRKVRTCSMGISFMGRTRVYLGVGMKPDSEKKFLGRPCNARIIEYDLHHSFWANSIGNFRVKLMRAREMEHYTDVVVINKM